MWLIISSLNISEATSAQELGDRRTSRCQKKLARHRERALLALVQGPLQQRARSRAKAMAESIRMLYKKRGSEE